LLESVPGAILDDKGTAATTDDESVEQSIVTVQMHNGAKKWEAQTSIDVKRYPASSTSTKSTYGTEWTNVGFTWSDAGGLILYINGIAVSEDLPGLVDTLPAKTAFNALVIGRGNDENDHDYVSVMFDDIAIWDVDLSLDPLVEKKLIGADCGDEGLCKLFYLCVKRSPILPPQQLSNI